MSPKAKPEDYTLGSHPDNKDKNRFPDILPGLPLFSTFITIRSRLYLKILFHCIYFFVRFQMYSGCQPIDTGRIS